MKDDNNAINSVFLLYPELSFVVRRVCSNGKVSLCMMLHGVLGWLKGTCVDRYVICISGMHWPPFRCRRPLD